MTDEEKAAIKRVSDQMKHAMAITLGRDGRPPGPLDWVAKRAELAVWTVELDMATGYLDELRRQGKVVEE